MELDLENNIDDSEIIPNVFYTQLDPIYTFGLANSNRKLKNSLKGFQISCTEQDKKSKKNKQKTR